MKRLSLQIQSKKHPGLPFLGYALVHEFNPKALSFFTAQKFPVDDELEVEVDFLGAHAKMKVRVTHLHEHISSGRVMNAIPSDDNPFPVRKFYRCYAIITALEGALPGQSAADAPSAAASAPTGVEAAPAAVEAPVAEAPAASDAPAAEAPGLSLVSESSAPSDSAKVAEQLAALSEEPKAA